MSLQVDIYSLTIEIKDLNQAITEVEDRGLQNQLRIFMESEQYLDAAIYFYKRQILKLDINDLAKFVMSLPDITEALRKSYITNLLNENIVPITMFALKKRLVQYQ